MIITCPCENKKKFKIDPALIPSEGRELKCGNCDRIWFYKIENNSPIENINISINEDINQINEKQVNTKTNDIGDNNLSSNEDLNKNKETEIKKDLKKKDLKLKTEKSVNKVSKFFSYLVVFLISLIALIILLDTLKTPLINIFPGLEIILFNLYETLKDIKLFIIDLS
ncbi:zinc-ribbon domain-containing protein [Candidatus Pelagibacter sp. HIMB1623]|uniref:zinc-ribbon domain-containing protein n=1 Tax=Candidatus Pelagibacter sp. HIMB1623 TaxID=3413358 RepID=UPI003F865122